MQAQHHPQPDPLLPTVIVIGSTAVLLSIYRAEVQQRARLLRRVQQQQRQQQPSGSQGEGAVVSSLPVAARQRAQAWLLAAVFVYILWSSWPAHTAPMPPAAAGV